MSKKAIDINDINIKNILILNNYSIGKECFKYFLLDDNIILMIA